MDDVSRETSTAPPPPPQAAGVFGVRLALVERYASWLAGHGVVRGLIGPRESARIWERHLLNCGVVAPAIPDGADVCDIGSGAGLPGLVLAIARPDLRVTLVEPLLRRTTFLEEVVADLPIANVEVVRGRAEDLHGRRDFMVVTSRAVAPLDRLLGWSMPLVRRGGSLVAMKGSSAPAEIHAAKHALVTYGAGRVGIETYGEGVIDPPTTVVRVEANHPSRLGLAPARKSGGSRRRS